MPSSLDSAPIPPPRGALARQVDGLLDRTILFSFDRSGFRRHARQFRPDDLAIDLTGRVCLVTGATSGIGRATAVGLAERGASTWLLCRDGARGEATVAEIRAQTGRSDVHLAVVDVASLASVRALAASLAVPKIDVLVHNAGVLPTARELTNDGFERTFATHVAGPFLLSHLLRERLRAAGEARMIFVSSGGMYAQRLSLDDVDWSRRPYDGVAAYAQTKRMQVVLAELFASRWAADGIRVNAMHPGWAETPAVRTSLPRFWRVMRSRLRTPEEGADTILWLAAAREAARSSGLFWLDRAPQGTHLLRRTQEQEADREALWGYCENVTGIGAEEARTRELRTATA
jgi:NAD(P)-dependent dehydrogenase (short-subunit alcohol dehydrogenase family)